jgi:hypothetical protein
MAAAVLCARRWRRPALLTALVAGLARGGAQWVVEAYCPTAAWSHGRSASGIEGGIGWQVATGDQLRTVAGRPNFAARARCPGNTARA